MTFYARIAFANVHPEQARSVVAIGDTVIAKSEGTQVLTVGIQKKYAEISYSLEDDEQEEVEEKKEQ